MAAQAEKQKGESMFKSTDEKSATQTIEPEAERLPFFARRLQTLHVRTGLKAGSKSLENGY